MAVAGLLTALTVSGAAAALAQDAQPTRDAVDVGDTFCAVKIAATARGFDDVDANAVVRTTALAVPVTRGSVVRTAVTGLGEAGQAIAHRVDTLRTRAALPIEGAVM